MAETDNVLGISGQIDITNIEQTLDNLNGKLNSVGVATEQLANKTTEALQKIESSTESTVSKHKQFTEVLKKAASEYNALIEGLPEKIRATQVQMDNVSASIAKIKDNISKANNNKDIAEYNRQLQAQTTIYDKLKSNVAVMQQVYDNANNTIANLSSGISIVNGIATINTGIVSAGAVAHGATAVATLSEAAAHTTNTSAISNETEASKEQTKSDEENTKAIEQKTEAIESYNRAIREIEEQIEETTKKYQELSYRQEDLDYGSDEYIENAKNIDVFYKHLKDLEEKRRNLLEEQRVEASAGKKDNVQDWLKEASEKAKDAYSNLSALLEEFDRLNDLNFAEPIKGIDDLVDAAAKLTKVQSESDFLSRDGFTNDNYKAYEKLQEGIEQLKQTELSKLDEKTQDATNNLQKIQEKLAEVRDYAKDLRSSFTLKDELSWDIGIPKFYTENVQKYEQAKEQIKELEFAEKEAQREVDGLNEELNRAQGINAYGEQQMSVSKLREEIREAKDEQQKLNAELEETEKKKPYEGQKGHIEALKGQIEGLTKKQEALNKELEGRPAISRFWSDLTSKVKNFFKAHSEGSQKAKKDASSLNSVISGIKGGARAGSGGLSGIFSMLTSKKALGWAAAIGVIVGAVKGISDSAEKLRIALSKLKPYVDEDTLGKLRQSFINTALNGSAQSTVDMAASATRWVRYFKQIRGSAEAVQTLVDASRELATITGQSADSITEKLTKIAGAFHLTGIEAKNSVNVLFNASQKSTVSIDELSSALVSTGQRAMQMGSSFKEMAAVIAMSAQNFPSASSAASSYLMVLQRLARQTKNEYNPLVVGATKALQNLNNAHLTGTQIQKMFGVRIANQARFFIQNADAIGKYTDNLDNAQGKEKALANAQSTATYNAAALKNSLTALGQAINLNITPWVNGLVKGLTSAINALGRLFSSSTGESWFDRMSGGFEALTRKMQENATWWDKILYYIGKYTINPLFGLNDSYKDKATAQIRIAVDNAYNSLKNDKNLKNLSDSEKKMFIQNAALGYIHPGASFAGAISETDALNVVNERIKALKQLETAKVEGVTPDIGLNNAVDDETKEKQAKTKREKRAKERFKELQEEGKIELQLANQNQQNTIDAMADGAARQRAQAKLDHEKRLQQIRQQAQEFINANIEKQASEYADKNPNGEGFYAQGKNAKINIIGLNGALNTITNPQGQTVGLTETQRNLIQAQIKAETQERLQQELELERQLIQAHQSFTDQKLAIDKKYQDDLAAIGAAIKEAELRNDQETVDALKRSREQLKDDYANQIAQFDYKNISAGIDWRALFSGVNNLATDMLKPILGQLENYTKTDKFANADSQTQRDITDLISEIRSYIGPEENEDRNQDAANLAGAISEFNTAVSKFNELLLRQNAANANLAIAKEQLDKGEISQADYNAIKKTATDASKATEDARKNVQKFGGAVITATDRLKGWSSNLTAELSKNGGTWSLIDGYDNIVKASGDIDSAINELRASFAQRDANGNAIKDKDDRYVLKNDNISQLAGKIATGMESVVNKMGSNIGNLIGGGIGQIVGFVAQIPKLILAFVNAIKEYVTGILNSITELISFDWLSDLVVSITDAIGNLINAIFDLPENLFHALEGVVVDGVGTLLNTIVGRVGNVVTLGGLSSKGPSDWVTNSNAKEVAKTIERLTERNKLLEKSIDDLKDTIKNQTGSNAINASERAITLQEELNENTLNKARKQASYHGHHHTFNHYWNGFTDEELSTLNAQFDANGLDSNWTGSFWDLSPEQTKILRENADIWERIQNTGKGGYGKRFAEYLSDYADQAGKVKEITDQLYETLTTTTKENIFDDALNSLYELANGSQDVFAEMDKNWQELVNKMVIKNTIGTQLQEWSDDFYKRVAEVQKKYAGVKDKNSTYYAQYLSELKALGEERVEKMKEYGETVEELRAAGLVVDTTNYEQNATAKGVSSITYDQANLLVNLGTARNIALEQGNEVRKLIQIDTTQLRVSTLQIQSDVSIMRDIQEQGLTQITRIEANTRPISEILEVINNIYRLQKETA